MRHIHTSSLLEHTELVWHERTISIPQIHHYYYHHRYIIIILSKSYLLLQRKRLENLLATLLLASPN